MLVVHVHIKVKPEAVQQFLEASIENARNSVQEPGIARFDVLQSVSDPTRFVLSEVYRSPDAPAAHRTTAHYQTWRDTVAEMMAEPHSGTQFESVFPPGEDW